MFWGIYIYIYIKYVKVHRHNICERTLPISFGANFSDFSVVLRGGTKLSPAAEDVGSLVALKTLQLVMAGKWI